jgi:hypothetical protein
MVCIDCGTEKRERERLDIYYYKVPLGRASPDRAWRLYSANEDRSAKERGILTLRGDNEYLVPNYPKYGSM